MGHIAHGESRWAPHPRRGALANKGAPRASKRLMIETGATGLEPATSGVTGRRSNQLNYAPGHSECSPAPAPGRWLPWAPVKVGLLALALVAALSACGGGGVQLDDARVRYGDAGQLALYKYDEGAPVGYRDKGPLKFLKPYPIKFHDITYFSPSGGYVPATSSFRPARARTRASSCCTARAGAAGPAVDRGWLAARGMVAMTIDAADAPAAAARGARGRPQAAARHRRADRGGRPTGVDVLHRCRRSARARRSGSSASAQARSRVRCSPASSRG